MRKLIAILLVVAMLLSVTACGSSSAEEGESVADIVAASQSLTHDELVALALAETGDFTVYGTSSRISTAADSFTELYGISVAATNVSDSEVYTKVDAEVEGGVQGADMILTQNGVEMLDRIDNEYFINFMPLSISDDVDDADSDPLVHQYINKLFIYNNVDGQEAITNIWQLTEPEYANKVFFKSPESETVNMNFLIMLTSDEWSDKLAIAYELYYGTAIDLGSYENAGYAFLAGFLSNCSFAITSDTTMAQEVSNEEAGDKMGLFVYSKVRSSSVLADNLSVLAYEDYDSAAIPFAGFMYPLYVTVISNTDQPYTAMLFIEYLMTEEGFSPWNSAVGSYSGNTSIAINEGDAELDFWKDCLVIEDPAYIAEVYADVYDFVSILLG